MFNNIISKTIHEKRWTLLFWSIGVTAMALLMMGFYHSFSQGGLGQVYENLPKTFQGLVGNLESLKTVPGYVSQEIFSLRIPMLTLIMGIIVFTGLLAGDENEGTLQTLLAQPVSRTRVFTEKYLAGTIISFIICASAIIGVWVGLIFIHEQMSFARLLEAVIGVWLLTQVFGTVGYALGAITGKRALSGSIAGLAAFGTYLITSFQPNVRGLTQIEKFSPFHYYNKPSITEYGLKFNNGLIMLTVIIIFLLISLIIFNKRDIYQR
jgi:ABC-2 type transport system permease protein